MELLIFEDVENFGLHIIAGFAASLVMYYTTAVFWWVKRSFLMFCR